MEKNPFLTEEKEMIVIARLVTVIMTLTVTMKSLSPKKKQNYELRSTSVTEIVQNGNVSALFAPPDSS